MKKNVCAVHGQINEQNSYVCNNPNGTTRLRCKECVRVQRIKHYYANQQRSIDNAAKWKENNRERVRELATIDRKNNPDKYRKWARDHYNKDPSLAGDKGVAWRFNIARDDYYSMIENQNNKCEICKQSETRLFKGKLMRLCLDHNHQTGKVRALLCHACNTGIGKFKENIELLQAAIDYLNHHK